MTIAPFYLMSNAPTDELASLELDELISTGDKPFNEPAEQAR